MPDIPDIKSSKVHHYLESGMTTKSPIMSMTLFALFEKEESNDH